jgi:hypothetical protein
MPALALDESDVGVYATVHVDGHVTDHLLRLTHPGPRWTVEDQKADGTWEEVTCEKECVLMESSKADIEHFLGKAPSGEHAECLHNVSFAICRVTDDTTPGQRQYLFVALTQEQPIVVRLARQEATQAWRDERGLASTDSDNRRSVDGFGGLLVVTSDQDWQEKWETPSNVIPDFTTAKVVHRGQRIFILTFFAGPKLNEQGLADITCDIDVIRPNGTHSTNRQGMECFHGKLQQEGLTYLSEPVIGFVGDPGDPSGEWVVRITLKDNVRHVVVPLKTSFTLVDQGVDPQ